MKRKVREVSVRQITPLKNTHTKGGLRTRAEGCISRPGRQCHTPTSTQTHKHTRKNTDTQAQTYTNSHTAVGGQESSRTRVTLRVLRKGHGRL